MAARRPAFHDTRLENGCTGSFSPHEDGLVLTNNHCTWGCIRNLSNDERNLSNEGFMALNRGEELQCPGQQISVLVEMENVTEQHRCGDSRTNRRRRQ